MEFLVLTNRARRCRVCREWTWWVNASAIRGDDGLCLDHADGYPCEDAPAEAVAAVRNLVRAGLLDHGGRRPESHTEGTTWVGGRWVKGGGTWRRPCPPPRTDTREPHERGKGHG
jgi:hypothetical protein